MTMDNPEDFTDYRRLEGHPQGPLAYAQGVADLYRRALGFSESE